MNFVKLCTGKMYSMKRNTRPRGFFHLCVLFESNRNHEIFFIIVYLKCTFSLGNVDFQAVFSLLIYFFLYSFCSLKFLLFLFKFSVA